MASGTLRSPYLRLARATCRKICRQILHLVEHLHPGISRLSSEIYYAKLILRQQLHRGSQLATVEH